MVATPYTAASDVAAGPAAMVAGPRCGLGSTTAWTGIRTIAHTTTARVVLKIGRGDLRTLAFEVPGSEGFAGKVLHHGYFSLATFLGKSGPPVGTAAGNKGG
jgi:hypothetical protein